MKFFILTALLYSTLLMARPIVLISYFDPFNRAPYNQSQLTAFALESRLNTQNSPITIKLCPLNTVFDKAYAQSEECLKALPKRPIMFLGLGEGTCQLEFETMVRNIDKTYGPNNEGNQRNNTKIIPQAEDVLGLRYPLPQMYCSLSPKERDDLGISNFAGTFVCNNTAFQMSYYYPELIYGFIHVPAHNCTHLNKRSVTAINIIEKMILAGSQYLLHEAEEPDLPHTHNSIRLPTKKTEIQKLRRQYQNNNECLAQYFRQSKSFNDHH